MREDMHKNSPRIILEAAMQAEACSSLRVFLKISAYNCAERTAMLRILKKAAIAVVATCLFIVTTVMGWITGFAGAFVRSQIPAQDDPDATSQDASSTAPATPAPDAANRLPSKGVR